MRNLRLIQCTFKIFFETIFVNKTISYISSFRNFRLMQCTFKILKKNSIVK